MNAVRTDPQTSTPVNGTMTELVSGILGDAHTLIKQQFAMMRAEVRQDVKNATQAGKLLGIGAALAAVGGLFVGVGVVYLLNWAAPELPLWACWVIVGGLLAAGGIAAVLAGRRYLATVTALPDQSIHALQENLSWITSRQK